MLIKIKQDNMNDNKPPMLMGMMNNQQEQVPTTHPVTGEVMYNNELMPNRAGTPNRSINDITAINNSYPLDPNKIPASQGAMTAKFGSIAKNLGAMKAFALEKNPNATTMKVGDKTMPITKTGSPALSYAQPGLILDNSASMGNEIAKDLAKTGKKIGAMQNGAMNEKDLEAYLDKL